MRIIRLIFLFFYAGVPSYLVQAQLPANDDSIYHYTGAKDQCVSIINRVADKIMENYDSVRYVYERYQEYAYIDSTKEIINAVQINSLRHESGVPDPFCKKQDKNSPIRRYFLGGTQYEKHKDYGYANLLHAAMSGSPNMQLTGEMENFRMNAYSTGDMDVIFELLIEKYSTIKPPKRRNNFICASSNRIRESHTHFELRDTIYNQQDCYLMQITTKELYTFDERDHAGRSEWLIEKMKELNGNWASLYMNVFFTIVVNKSDDAILMSRRDIECSNDYNEHRSFSSMTKYEKKGNYYYKTYDESKMPSIFTLVDQKAGINDRDMYSLVISEFADAQIDKKKEKEMGIRKWNSVSFNTPYSKLLKKETTVNDDIQSLWNDYWKSAVK